MRASEHDGLIEDEGAGYLISVSDLMAGLLFVFILTLMAFVLSFQFAKTHTEEVRRTLVAAKQRAEEERDRLRTVVTGLTNTRQVRDALLEELRERLVRSGVAVEVDREHGILHLPERAVHFPTASAELPPREALKLVALARALAAVLPCYVAAPKAERSCSDEVHTGKLESVLIEGHTDNRPYFGDRFHDNWDLSAQRAMYTYRIVTAEAPALERMRNAEMFPVFGVAGYGDGRPRRAHEEPTDDPINRRIDLRFIMAPPRATPEVVRALEEETR